MEQDGSSKARPARRPFGPRLRQQEWDITRRPERQKTMSADGEPNHTTIPLVNDERYGAGTSESTLHESSKPSKLRRPLPPRPRNHLKDSRRRPLPPTTAQSEIHDVPFSFSSRSSQFTHLHMPDPVKDLFGTQDGIPSDDPIWKSYMDEAQHQDKNTVGHWNQSMDVILIFAGLFSAILTAFIIEFYQCLQPDPQQSAANQLVIITQLLQAGLAGENAPAHSIRAIDSGDQLFSASSTAIGVNTLWFISLTCSLGAAIGAMVIKQWLQFYTIGLSPNAYEYAHQHQYRLNALLAWHVPSIISALPFIMLVSVGLFLVGLGWQLLQLHMTVAIVVISFMAMVLFCYALSLVLSLLYPGCPYKTSALVLLQSIWRKSVLLLQKLQVYKKKPVAKSASVIDNIEISEIKDQQPQLAINSISWLLEVSQKEIDIHNALVSIKQFRYTPDMITRLLSSNALEQLAQRAIVPLPPLAHDFWNHLDQVLPSHPIFEKFSTARVHMQTLISVWHHPSYLAMNRPPAISEKHDLERQERLWDIIKDRKDITGRQQSLDEESLQVTDSQCSSLLGDWLLFWRLLKQQHGNKVNNLARQGYDLNIYVHIVCTEICYYHLQTNVTPLYLPQNRGAFIDLHEILEAVYEEGPHMLDLVDESIWLLLDTLAYVFSGIDNAPLELQGLPRTWFSPSQSPSLTRKETVFLLIQLLAQNSMRYNLVSKKILLCLQMLLPVPMVASSRRSFFLQYQQDKPSERELSEQMNMTLEGLINVFIPQLNRPPQLSGSLQPDAVMESELHTRIASLALTQLVKSILKSDAPTKYHDSIFLALPPVYFGHVLTSLEDMNWNSQMSGQVARVHELITEWQNHGLLNDHGNLTKCINIFQQTLLPDWAELDLQLVVGNVFNFLGGLWKNSDPFYGNLVSSALCDILNQSFTKSQKNRKILAQFIEMQALLAVAVFLTSDECSEESRRKWLILCADWEKWRQHYTPSAQEVYQFEGLKNAAARA